MEKILVTISGYYERFQINTIESCLKRAKYPERISFAIAHHEDHVVDTSHLSARISRYIIPKGDKTGIQKAKHILSTMLDDEDYLLSIDSHVILMQDWDEEIINDYKDRVLNAENKKIVISGNFGNSMNIGDLDYDTCLDLYFNNNDFFKEKENNAMEEFIIDRNDSVIKDKSSHYDLMLSKTFMLSFGNGQNIRHLSNIYSGNFSFFPRSWFDDGNNFSKQMFFSADQPETALNIYTSGYDIWMPRKKYHIHMVDHSSKVENISYTIDGQNMTANRFFDIEKDKSGILWFLNVINNGYNEIRPRSIDDFCKFFNLDKEKYKNVRI